MSGFFSVLELLQEASYTESSRSSEQLIAQLSARRGHMLPRIAVSKHNF